ncbi:hypothetical protein CL619_02890 [archaeon]|nr:hypothetical protein [archaeon]
MDYLTQSSGMRYAASALEYSVSNTPSITYSAVASVLSNFALSYSSPLSNSFIEKSYFSNSPFPQSRLSNSSFNSNYLSSIMTSYGADPSAVRAKESSLDLMSKERDTLTHVETSFHPSEFIRLKAGGIFVSGAEEIQSQIKETFEKLMGENFPDDIKVSVLSASEFRKICPKIGVVGLSYNRRQLGLISEIFVKEGSLASVMLTIGHEIGHVLTSTLEDPSLEEAKAYAFSFAWMEIIRKHDIAGLAGSFVSTLPAANGVHDKGYNLVKKMFVSGKKAFGVYRGLILGNLC